MLELDLNCSITFFIRGTSVQINVYLRKGFYLCCNLVGGFLCQNSKMNSPGLQNFHAVSSFLYAFVFLALFGEAGN